MLRKAIFGVKSDDGYKIRSHRRNAVRVARGKEEMFVFVEPLATTPASYQIDTSQVWLDAKVTKPLGDPHLAASVIAMVVAYFQLKSIGAEVC